MASFADKIRKLRKSYGLSQEKFARRLGIGRDYLSQLENGRIPGKSVERMVEIFERAAIVGQDAVVLEEDAGVFNSTHSGGLRTQCEEHLRSYLNEAEKHPGALAHALFTLQLHLPLEALSRFGKDKK
jgi:transcriptional regulator with XRE-family HTH domain